jgi:hypothetical protein
MKTILSFSFRKAFAKLPALVFLLGVSAIAVAQSSAVLNGNVTDATGAAVANAKVVASNIATGVTATSRTDNAGAYLFP